jgi:hypothetical protein
VERIESRGPDRAGGGPTEMTESNSPDEEELEEQVEEVVETIKEKIGRTVENAD